jgi:hypothetical protein
VAQGVGPELKPQYCLKKRKEKELMMSLPRGSLLSYESLSN